MHQELPHVREPFDERPLVLPLDRKAPDSLVEAFGHVKTAIGPKAPVRKTREAQYRDTEGADSATAVRTEFLLLELVSFQAGGR